MKRMVGFVMAVALLTAAAFWAGERLGTSVMDKMGTFCSMPLDLRFQEETKALCRVLCQERLQLVQMLEQEKVSRDVIYRKIEAIGQRQVQLEKQTVTHLINMRKKMTAAEHQRLLSQIRYQLEKGMIHN